MKMAGCLNTARSLQQEHNGCPSIGDQVACKKLLITSCAPVPVPLLPNTLLTFQKSHIPPHTPAHKHGTKIFQYCVMKGNTMNHMTSWMDTENSVQLIVPTKWEYEHRAATEFETFISYKSPIVRTQSVTVNSAEQSPSWEADQISASQEIHWNFWNPKVQ